MYVLTDYWAEKSSMDNSLSYLSQGARACIHSQMGEMDGHDWQAAKEN